MAAGTPDQPFTTERLKLLVLYEEYPGHDYHLWRRELDARKGYQPLDSLVAITNTLSIPLFEGIGDNAALFLGYSTVETRPYMITSASAFSPAQQLSFPSRTQVHPLMTTLAGP
jgi:hypothetical protein